MGRVAHAVPACLASFHDVRTKHITGSPFFEKKAKVHDGRGRFLPVRAFANAVASLSQSLGTPSTSASRSRG
eukprot:7377927-Prorocentrum_lima.AAC.1